MKLTLTGVIGSQTVSSSSSVPSNRLLYRDIAAGDYLLEFQAFVDAPFYPKEITWNGARLSDHLLRLPPDSERTLHIVLALDVATIAVSVSGAEGKPAPYATVLLIPDFVTSVRDLSWGSVHGIASPNGTYTSPPLVPGKYRVLATTQTVRWNVPEDLEHVLPVLFQGKDVEVAPKTTAPVTVSPVVIF